VQKWKSFNIQVIEGEVALGDVRVAVRSALIPLKKEAIALNVAVPSGKEAEADALLTQLLAGLDGPSNWLTEGDIAERLGYMTAEAAFFGGAIVFGIVMWVRAKHKRSRQSPA
jgi:hypothetical protein